MRAFRDAIMLVLSIPAALVVVMLAALLWVVSVVYLVAWEVVRCIGRRVW